jgi:hypothetical protein
MKKKSSSKVHAIRVSKKLRTSPVVQAGAAVVLARWQMFDEDGGVPEPEDDSVPQVAWEVYFKALGLSQGDRREGEVADAISELAFEMQHVLIKRGLLQKDCALKLQARRAA